MRRRTPLRPRASGGRRLALTLGFLLLGLATLFTMVDYRLRPVVESIAAHQAKVAAVRGINTAMAAVMAEEGVSYGDIVAVNKDETGKITSIEANMMLVNHLKLAATDRILEEIQKEDNQLVRIPLGNLTGLQFFSDRGPDVEIRVIPLGYVQTSIHNQFTSAGINQTLHRIMLETGIQVLIQLPGRTIRAETTTAYCIAETVIVGEVPEAYAGIRLDETPVFSRIETPAASG
jgi:sporulation protein YunB